MVEAQQHLGLAPPLWKAVGALEVLGAAGLAVGLHEDLPVVGVLAAAGLVALTIGATFYHQRAGDRIPEWLPAVVMGSSMLRSPVPPSTRVTRRAVPSRGSMICS